MIKRPIVSFFVGFLKCSVKDGDIPAFFTKCLTGGVCIYCRRHETDGAVFYSKAGDFEKVSDYAARTGSVLSVTGRYGVPFICEDIKRNATLWASAALCFSVLLLSSLFIWEVDIEGDCGLPLSEVYAAVKESGVAPGRLCSSVVTRVAANSILLKLPELSWATVNIDGSRATVTLWPMGDVTEVQPDPGPCDMVSDKEGIIEKTFYLSGMGVAPVGAAVFKGDVLAVGRVKDAQDTYRTVGCRGFVILRTRHVFKASLPKSAERSYPGKKVNTWYLSLGKRIIPLTLIERSGVMCYDIYTEKYESRRFPLSLIKATAVERVSEPFTVTPERANEVFKRFFAEKEALLDEHEVISSEMTVTEYEDRYEAEFRLECLEKAGAFVPVDE